ALVQAREQRVGERVVERVERAVDDQRVERVARVERATAEARGVAQHRAGLGQREPVDLEHRHAAERERALRLERRELGEGEAAGLRWSAVVSQSASDLRGAEVAGW